ncbi:MAG: CoA-binding protein [Chloroflexia bacterium]
MVEHNGDGDYARPEDIQRILDFKTIAVVGLSPDPFRPSQVVASYLQRRGYRILPVNPYCEFVLSERSYPSLSAIPYPIEVVDVFRNSRAVRDVVEEAIAVGAKAVWLQEGVIDEAAAARARSSELLVVMDRCLLKEHAFLRAHKRSASAEGDAAPTP